MSSVSDFKFRAFISYSSRDRLVGESFQRELERYKLPRPLRGRLTDAGAVPTRIAPIFRDRWDLVASEDLSERIGMALVASHSLIVLCSPNSARSKWVEEEIVTFKRMGRGQRITAVIIDGDPVAFDPQNAPNGAFPPALLQEIGPDGLPTGERSPEPFAPDVREMRPDGSGGDGFEYAKLKVVARIVDVPLAELTQRQREVERRERRVIQGVAAGMFGLAVAATGGGWLAWRQTLAANARLDQTIDMAARQIGAAAHYENRYGVSSAVIRDMLLSAQRDFAGLLSQARGSPRLGLQAARLGLSFAEAFEDAGDREGRYAKALSEAEQELAHLESRTRSLTERIGLSTAPSGEDIARAKLRLLGARARQATEANQYEKALAENKQRLALSTEWAERTRGIEWRREAALTLLREGNIHYDGGQMERAKAAYKAGISGIEKLVAADGRVIYRDDQLRGLTDLAQLLSESGEHRDALVQQQRAEAIVRGLAAERPQDTDLKLELVMVLTRVGDAILNISGDQTAALAKYTEAAPLVRELTASDPQRIDWRRALYIVLERAGSARFQLGDIAAAERDFEEALAIVEPLSRQAPSDPRRQYDTGVMLERMGQLRMAQAEFAPSDAERTARLRQAAEPLARLVSIREQAVKSTPGGKIQLYHHAVALLTLGDVHGAIPGGEAESAALLDRARQVLEGLTAAHDVRLEWYRTLAAVHVKSAQARLRSGRKDEAVAGFERAIAIVRDLRKREPDNERFPHDEEELTAEVARLKDK